MSYAHISFHLLNREVTIGFVLGNRLSTLKKRQTFHLPNPILIKLKFNLKSFGSNPPFLSSVAVKQNGRRSTPIRSDVELFKHEL